MKLENVITQIQSYLKFYCVFFMIIFVTAFAIETTLWLFTNIDTSALEKRYMDILKFSLIATAVVLLLYESKIIVKGKKVDISYAIMQGCAIAIIFRVME